MLVLPRFPKTKTIHDHDYIARLLRFELEKVGHVSGHMREGYGRMACRKCYVHPCSYTIFMNRINIPLDNVKWQSWNSFLSLRKAADEVDHLENFYGKCHPMKTDEVSLASG